MAREALEFLNPANSSGVWVDCTLGGGGHAQLICGQLGPESLFIGIDRDPAALEIAADRLKGARCEVKLVRAHFGELSEILSETDRQLRGVIYDLGLSSNQIDRGSGFSFRDLRAPLDMRQDPDQDLTAADVLNTSGEKELADIIFYNADERFSRRIAAAVVRARPLSRMEDLVHAVLKSLPKGYRRKDDVLRRVSQAIRMEVNQELPQLESSLEVAEGRLGQGGRIVVLSYHSGEDRIVKQFFRRKKLEGSIEILTRKPLKPTAEETRQNSRSKPAILRAAEKI